jgi:hypothetical protein
MAKSGESAVLTTLGRSPYQTKASNRADLTDPLARIDLLQATSVFDASRVARVPAKVPSLSPQRSLRLGGGNGSKCPIAGIADSQSPDLSGAESRHSFSRHFWPRYAAAVSRRYDIE